MRILICVKQTSQADKVYIDPDSMRILSEDKKIINDFDLYAVKAASKIKRDYEDTHVTVISMGDDGADSVLRDVLALVADEAYHIKDDRFINADVRMSAAVLCRAISHLEEEGGMFDLVFCGMKSTDSGTAATAPYLSVLLERRFIGRTLSCEVIKGNASDRDLCLEIRKESDAAELLFRAKTPLIISFTKNKSEPEYPLIERIIEVANTQIPVLDADILFPEGDLPRPYIKVTSFEYHSSGRSSKVIDGDDKEAVRALAGKIISLSS